MFSMTSNQRELGRKLRILKYARKIGEVANTCRYFEIGRAISIAGVRPVKCRARSVRAA